MVVMFLSDVKVQRRKDYERERKNAKRVALYRLLPEPERSRRLASNAQRRACHMRWTQEPKPVRYK